MERIAYLIDKILIGVLLLSIITPATPCTISSPQKLDIALVEQPQDNNMFVPSVYGQASLFKDAEQYDSIGILAHDYLSGKEFYLLSIGDIIQYDCRGEIRYYKVSETIRYFPIKTKSPEAMYQTIYTVPGRMVLQTCMGSGWYFVIAYPILETLPPMIYNYLPVVKNKHRPVLPECYCK